MTRQQRGFPRMYLEFKDNTEHFSPSSWVRSFLIVTIKRHPRRNYKFGTPVVGALSAFNTNMWNAAV